jgi:hypothetical protein
MHYVYCGVLIASTIFYRRLIMVLNGCLNSQACSREVDFCCTVVVPANFDRTMVMDNMNQMIPAQPTVGIDTSCLQCVVDQCTTRGTAADPCGGEDLECDVMLDVIKAVGCIPFYVSLPVTNSNNNTSTAVCCSGTVCVDNILCVACNGNDQACPDFDQTTVLVTAVTAATENVCGETALEITGTITLPDCVTTP